ncbi:transposase [Nonomuraea sp. NPDC002799]
MRHGDLTNAEWNRLAPLLPADCAGSAASAERGVPAAHGDRSGGHRTVINAVLYQARTGSRWRHLPERFGCWVDIYRHDRLWHADGTWQRLLTAFQAAGDPASASLRAQLALVVDRRNA